MPEHAKGDPVTLIAFFKQNDAISQGYQECYEVLCEKNVIKRKLQTAPDKNRSKSRHSYAYHAEQCLYVGQNKKVFFFSKASGVAGGIELNILKTPEEIKAGREKLEIEKGN